ncbi:MAG: PDZ domain-containing protein, partial [Micromonosporaceae bacterium]|nr:PDZ domain-containing protein [Micromonosporaceae bacterium]
MAYTLGVVLFALGILVSICLHEAGHMYTAKAFGMKVTRYFAGFGPTLWSFQKGETEYGVKAIPAGGFVKIVGMTPLEDEEEVGPEDKHRVFWRKPLWQRTVVLSAGSITHFILAFLILWFTAVFVGLPNAADASTPASRVEIGIVEKCVSPEWEWDAKTQQTVPCKPGSDPKSPAAKVGLQPGDVIISFNGERVTSWTALVKEVRTSGGERVTLTYQRDGQKHDAAVTLPVVERPTLKAQSSKKNPAKLTDQDMEQVGVVGV